MTKWHNTVPEDQASILVAGSILTDVVKVLDRYPAPGMLANVLSLSQAVGGCVPNTAMDLAKMDPTLPVYAAGRIGKDAYGQFLLEQMQGGGVDCRYVRQSPDTSTSFSDVMSPVNGERTFFCVRGASGEFCPADLPLTELPCRMLHIGYILLLDSFDQPDEEYGTVLARFLHDAEAAGIRTSIDVVSDSEADYQRMVLPALRQCSYAIMNEVESSLVSGLPHRDEAGRLLRENIRSTMTRMAQEGVKEKVIIHAREACFCLDVPTGHFTQERSLALPRELIRGNVGAGDAFCAGCLYSIFRGDDDARILSFASAAAACSLLAENATDGMRSWQEVEQFAQMYGRMTE